MKKLLTGMAVVIASTLTVNALAKSCLIRLADESHPVAIVNTSSTPVQFTVSNTADNTKYAVDEVYITMPKYCGVVGSPKEPNLPYDLYVGRSIQCSVPTTTSDQKSYITLNARERGEQYVIVNNMNANVHLEGATCQ